MKTIHYLTMAAATFGLLTGVAQAQAWSDWLGVDAELPNRLVSPTDTGDSGFAMGGLRRDVI